MKRCLTLLTMFLLLNWTPTYTQANESERKTWHHYTYRVCEQGAIICDYDGAQQEITIPEEIDGHPVVGIGDYAFYGMGIQEVSLPEGLLFLGLESFSENPLCKINLPQSLIEIGEAAFAYTTLEEIVLPDNIERLGRAAFFECNSLKKVVLSTSLTEIPEACFFECLMLSDIEIPEGVTIIGDSCFYYCPLLTDVRLPQSLMTIGCEAFASCFGLETLYLPEHVLSLGFNCFMNCSGLQKINIPKGIQIDEAWDEFLFLRCDQLTLEIYAGSEVERFAQQYDIKYRIID